MKLIRKKTKKKINNKIIISNSKINNHVFGSFLKIQAMNQQNALLMIAIL